MYFQIDRDGEFGCPQNIEGLKAEYFFKLPLWLEGISGTGDVRWRTKKTVVALLKPNKSESGYVGLYEEGYLLGCFSGRWHIHMEQLCPLGPSGLPITAFLERLNTLVYNRLYWCLSKNQLKSCWVRDSISSRFCLRKALKYYLDIVYGINRIAYCPDNKCNNISRKYGYKIIKPDDLGLWTWSRAMRLGLIKPACNHHHLSLSKV